MIRPQTWLAPEVQKRRLPTPRQRELLRLITQAHTRGENLSVQEMARALEAYPGTILDLLRGLNQRGWVTWQRRQNRTVVPVAPYLWETPPKAPPAPALKASPWPPPALNPGPVSTRRSGGNSGCGSPEAVDAKVALIVETLRTCSLSPEALLRRVRCLDALCVAEERKLIAWRRCPLPAAREPSSRKKRKGPPAGFWVLLELAPDTLST